MPIEHAILHRLRRVAEAAAEPALRDAELGTDGPAGELLDALKSGFLGRITREHGRFGDADGTSSLAAELTAVLGRERDFIDASRALIERFAALLDESKAELDAHCALFVERSGEHHHVFYLLVAGHKEALSVDPELQVRVTRSIDAGASLFGIKVDLAEWRERRDYTYLTLVAPRGNGALADAFRRLTGFADGLDKAEATMAFLEGVEAYSREVPEEQVQEYRQQVVDYCLERDAMDEPVDYRELAFSLDGVDGDAFVRTVTEHAPPERDVMVDRRALRRFVQFAGREKDLSISFGSHQLNRRVVYDPANDTLSIKGLPRALRDQLQGHVKGGGD